MSNYPLPDDKHSHPEPPSATQPMRRAYEVIGAAQLAHPKSPEVKALAELAVELQELVRDYRHGTTQARAALTALDSKHVIDLERRVM